MILFAQRRVWPEHCTQRNTVLMLPAKSMSIREDTSWKTTLGTIICVLHFDYSRSKKIFSSCWTTGQKTQLHAEESDSIIRADLPQQSKAVLVYYLLWSCSCSSWERQISSCRNIRPQTRINEKVNYRTAVLQCILIHQFKREATKFTEVVLLYLTTVLQWLL